MKRNRPYDILLLEDHVLNEEIGFDVLKKDKRKLKNKVKRLNHYNDDWFFVVTDKNLKTKYKEYGKVFEKRYLKNQLLKYLEKVR